ncbi:alpha-amylase [Petrotoga sp. 9PW.55.5.1]|uniref:alpha-amylase n=1 Tax=Petrotoga sp. 9PW.55.5.1 TaxID=1308979 RepID=UPI000DDB34FA|nr:alpha-amylase [Petrotoga sp. 9PW.55.5.1]
MKKNFFILTFITIFFLYACLGNIIDNENDQFYPKIPEELNNETIMQAFYWEMGTGDYLKNYPEEEKLWRLLAQKAPELSEVGITALWLPPANKAMNGIYDVGYATYDLCDLGEFNQKGTIRTKYGTKKELESAIAALHDEGIKVYYDAVLNHRMGADRTEKVRLSSQSPDKPNEEISAWTVFNFPGRNNKYSEMKWNWQHFDSVDENLFEGKSWDWTFYMDNDYLMGADVDYENLEVQKDVTDWGKWIINDIDFDGFRLDAAKHIDYRFINSWIDDIQNNTDKDVFFVGEAWIEDVSELARFLDTVDNEDLKVFDFPLRSFFVDMIDGADLRNLEYVGLINIDGYKDKAVTFVDNHDTNRDEDEKAGILRRKYQSYAYILTREHGTPVVFWKDYYIWGMKEELDKLLLARKYFAYGPGYEVDNNDEDVYSYVRAGLPDVEGDGLVLMISDGESRKITTKSINSRQPNTTFYDFTGHIAERVTTDESGYGDFKVIMSENEGWSVWVPLVE